MTLFRVHRGGLDESMKVTIEVHSRAEIVAYLNSIWVSGPAVELSEIDVKPFMYDARVDWDTHMVLQNGQCIGYTNGPLPP